VNLFYELEQPDKSWPNPYIPQPPTNALQQIQSAGYLIRETLFTAVAEREPFFANYKTKRRTKMDPVQANALPFLGIYLGKEKMGPDGDANAGDTRFSHTLPIHFSVIIANNNADDAERTLDQAYNRIMQRIFRDAWVMNVLRTTNPWSHLENAGDVKIESVVNGQKETVFGLASGNNETPIGELRYVMSVFFRSPWDPVF
jgi:hypothetical protein